MQIFFWQVCKIKSETFPFDLHTTEHNSIGYRNQKNASLANMMTKKSLVVLQNTSK